MTRKKVKGQNTFTQVVWPMRIFNVTEKGDREKTDRTKGNMSVLLGLRSGRKKAETVESVIYGYGRKFFGEKSLSC